MQKNIFRQSLLAATIALLGALSAPGAVMAQDASPAAATAADKSLLVRSLLSEQNTP